MSLFAKAAGIFKYGRLGWVKVAGVWRSIQFVKIKNAGNWPNNSNYIRGLYVSAFVQSNYVGEATGDVNYSLSSSASALAGQYGHFDAVPMGAVLNNLTVSEGSNGVNYITLNMWDFNIAPVPVPASVSVGFYNGSNGYIGGVTLSKVSQTAGTVRYSVGGTGAAGAAIEDLIRAIRNDITYSPIYRRVDVNFL